MSKVHLESHPNPEDRAPPKNACTVRNVEEPDDEGDGFIDDDNNQTDVTE